MLSDQKEEATRSEANNRDDLSIWHHFMQWPDTFSGKDLAVRMTLFFLSSTRSIIITSETWVDPWYIVYRCDSFVKDHQCKGRKCHECARSDPTTGWCSGRAALEMGFGNICQIENRIFVAAFRSCDMRKTWFKSATVQVSATSKYHDRIREQVEATSDLRHTYSLHRCDAAGDSIRNSIHQRATGDYWRVDCPGRWFDLKRHMCKSDLRNMWAIRSRNCDGRWK